MNDIPLAIFKDAIRATHGASATFVERVYVDERFECDPVWQGEVLVFDIQGHPSAVRCYAWEVDGDVTCVLDAGGVNSPLKAVRASILAGGEN